MFLYTCTPEKQVVSAMQDSTFPEAPPSLLYFLKKLPEKASTMLSYSVMLCRLFCIVTLKVHIYRIYAAFSVSSVTILFRHKRFGQRSPSILVAIVFVSPLRIAHFNLIGDFRDAWWTGVLSFVHSSSLKSQTKYYCLFGQALHINWFQTQSC